MSPRSSTRAARTALVVAMAALAALMSTAVSGCSTLGAPKPAAHQATAVGQCTELSANQEVDAASDTNPLVPCTAPHTTQIFALGTVTGEFGERTARPDLQILKGLQDQLCGIDALRSFVGASARDAVTGLQIRAYFPTIAEWAAGSRRVECAASVAGRAEGPAEVDYSLSDVLATPHAAAVLSCYRQEAAATGGWASTGKAVSCAEAHSTQDLNAWLPLGDSPAVTAQKVASTCTPFARQYFAHGKVPAGVRVSGVVWRNSNDTYTLRCAIGGDSGHGDVTGAIPTSA